MSTTEHDFGPQTAFITEKGKADDNGTIRVTKTDYLAFSETQGLPQAVLRQVADHRSSMIGGMIDAGTPKLEEKIKKARENGDDPAGLTQEIHVATESGTLRAILKSKREFPNPLAAQNGGPEKTTRYGVVDVQLRMKSIIPKGPAAACATRIKAAMGVTD